jgi:hypothetical protein
LVDILARIPEVPLASIPGGSSREGKGRARSPQSAASRAASSAARLRSRTRPAAKTLQTSRRWGGRWGLIGPRRCIP